MGELKIFCSGRGNEELKIIRSPFSLFRLHLFLYQNNIEGVFLVRYVFLLCGVPKKVMFDMHVAAVLLTGGVFLMP